MASQNRRNGISGGTGIPPSPPMNALHTLRQSLRVIVDAFYRFNRDDGWAIASHISLSVLLAVFPFLIVCTAIAGFVGSSNLADEGARVMFLVWARQVGT